MQRTLNLIPGLLLKLLYGLVLVSAANATVSAQDKVDKSAVGPNTISLPKGPGSIEGLGEAFQPTLNTGTAKYGFRIMLPPGPSGNTPSLALAYEGGSGNGCLGFGWSLDGPFVQRQTDKGIPRYADVEGLALSADTFINDLKEELVPVTQEGRTNFFCRNEGPFVRYRFHGDYWEGTLPDGTRQVFGQSVQAQIADPVNPRRIFRWLLERQIDTRGNTVEYRYQAFTNKTNTAQKYLVSVAYGPGPAPWKNFHFAQFEYESRDDWFEDCRAGFPIRTGKRLKSIIVGTQGLELAGHAQDNFHYDSLLSNLNRRYELSYQTNSFWSLLERVQLHGSREAPPLPPLRFSYSECKPMPELSAEGKMIHWGHGLPPGFHAFAEGPVDLVDLNGDGLTDLLETTPGRHRAYVNYGPRLADGRIAWGIEQPIASVDGQALNLDLFDGGVLLADVNGDGLADLVQVALGDNVYYHRNIPDLPARALRWGELRTMSRQDDMPPSPFLNRQAKLADLNFDKRMDVVESDGEIYYFWLVTADQTFSPRQFSRALLGYELGTPGVHLTDFNGDRVPDLIAIDSRQISVMPGLGYGLFGPEEKINLEPGEPFSLEQIGKAKLLDLDGDGLPELVVDDTGLGEIWFWPNRGNYTLGAQRRIKDLSAGFGPEAQVRWVDLNGNGTLDYVVDDPSREPPLQMLDVGELLGCVPRPHLLTKIDNGIGRVQQLEYSTSTEFILADGTDPSGEYHYPWSQPLPFPIDVVTKVTTEDSLGNAYVAHFRYHDGYYDPTEKQFRGFGRVEQIDIGDTTAPTLVTRSLFDTGREYEAMKGKLHSLRAEQEDGKAFFWEETNVWNRVTLMTNTTGQAVNYVHPMAKLRTIAELSPSNIWRQLKSEFSYDNYGNQTRNADYGIVENGGTSTFSDDRITTTEYALNLDAWILRHPCRQEIKDLNGKVISRVESFYDDHTFAGNNLCEVSVGNLTLRREWVDPANSSAYVEAARTKYDPFGNPVVLLDPLAVADSQGVVDFTKGHAREIAYDNDFHTYPTTETIHVGSGSQPLLFQARYDPGFGTVTSSIDFNGNTNIYGYDVFARLINIVKPYDTTDYPTVEYEYKLAVPFPRRLGGGEGQGEGIVNYIETRQRDTSEIRNPKSEMYLRSRQFVDGLGRKLMSKQEAESAPGLSTPRVVATEATLFNARQKPSRVLNPHFSLLDGATLDELLAFEDIEAPGWQGAFEQNGSLANLNLAGAHQSFTEYDATLRELRHTNPDGTQSRTVYEPLLTRSYDENDNDPTSPYFDTPMVHYNDGLGRLVQVDERARLNDDGTPSGTINTWTTRYEYDLNDQLTQITDSQSNVKTMAYDGLKRKTFMDDPDRGHMSYVYDDASNLRETTDAKGQRITYTYDGANRILTEDYLDEGQPFSANRTFNPAQPISRSNRPDVAYFYDFPVLGLDQGDTKIATAQNTRGMLAYVWDLSGEEHTSYDARGRVEYTVKRIPDSMFYPTLQGLNPPADPQLVSYKTAFEYDSLDRMTRLVYPDNDEVTYEYNERSLLRRIPGGPNGSIISNLVYQPSAQQKQIDYGNGIRTTYDYDNRLRLTKLLTFRTFASNDDPQLIHFSYDFDGVSNIRQITDNRPGSAVPEGDKRRNTQIFSYDDLYRLTRAQYSFNLPGQSVRNDGVVNYRYDRIGNMMAQTSDIVHNEKGLPVANLGEMDSGGVAGRWKRQGRKAADPPGPHALTQIRNAQTTIRNRDYPYDANGNMLNIDGLICAWDFKDRLVAVENDEMRAEYSYDYTDRRISKRVKKKERALSSGGTDSLSNSLTESFNVTYPGKHFEVREHDAPAKYVWNGEARVAKVIGSLKHTFRAQRLRVYLGWNLCSLAVTTQEVLAQLGPAPTELPLISVAFKWDPPARNWLPVAARETLTAGTVLWLKSTANATLTVTGTYSDPTNRTVAADGAFLPSAGLKPWNLKSALANSSSSTVLTYDTPIARWLAWLPPPLVLESDLPAFIAPGQAVFARADGLLQIEVLDCHINILFYHQDHLGSPSCITESSGNLGHENAYFPTGENRSQYYRPSFEENYAFAQKEQDRESALQYFQTRYLQGLFASFLTPDRFLAELPSMGIMLESTRRQYQRALRKPQQWNLYAYATRNPVNLTDPSGQDVSLEDPYKGVVGAKQALSAQERELFDRAMQRLGETDEGKRILQSLGSMNIKFRSEATATKYANSPDSKSGAWGVTFEQDVNAQQLHGKLVGRANSAIDLRDIAGNTKVTEDQKIRLVAFVLYHELRRIEGFALGDTQINERLSEQRFPSTDPRERAFQQQINVPFKTGPDGRFRLWTPPASYDSFHRIKG